MIGENKLEMTEVNFTELLIQIQLPNPIHTYFIFG
jgi:hypothetical protein